MTDHITLPMPRDPDDAPRIGDAYEGRITSTARSATTGPR